MKDAPIGTESATAAQFVDYDNDGLLDLIVDTPKGLVVSRNLGGEWTAADGRIFKTTADSAKSNAIYSADLDGDGDVDLMIFDTSGTLRFLRNDGGTNNSETLRLQGRASNKSGIGAKIDMRAGSLTQKLETYSASPMPAPSDVHFGLGKREKPDAVRVIWASGTVQAEVDFPAKSADQTAKNISPLQNRRTRPQTVVVSVSLHLERRKIRICYRLFRRRRDGKLGRSGSLSITPIQMNLCESHPIN